MTIEWSDSFSIGDEQIDAQHKYLFRLANEFLQATTPEKQKECVAYLFEYTREHFGYEEDLMRKVNFGEYEAHVLMHHALINRLTVVSKHIAQNTLNKGELESFIKDWAFGHIPKADARLAAYLDRLTNTDTVKGRFDLT